MDRQVLKGEAMNFHQAFLRANLDRPTSGPTYSDAYIDHWGGAYLANPQLRLLGCPFGRFLTNPAWWLAFAGNPTRDQGDDHRYPLSSKERQVVREALSRTNTTVSGSRPMEKLRHHRYPRSFRNFIQLRDM